MSVSTYQNKLRVRVSGLLIQDEKLLLVELKSPLIDQYIWIPPGGGVDFGETMHQALIREFEEETGIEIEVGDLLFTNELIHEPYHAIEFYFSVKQLGGKLFLGSDPEHNADDQIIRAARFISLSEIEKLKFQPPQLVELAQNALQNKNASPFFNSAS